MWKLGSPAMTPGPRAPARPEPPGVTAARPRPSTCQPRARSINAAQAGPPRSSAPSAAAQLPGIQGLALPPTWRSRAASASRRPAAASGPLLLPAAGEGAGGGHIRRVPSPGDGAPGRPRIVALALRASGHTPQSPASWPSSGPKESGRKSLPVSRSSSSYSRHLRWRPQRPRRRDSRAAPANEPCTRCSSSRPAAPPALGFCVSPPGRGLQTWLGHLSL